MTKDIPIGINIPSIFDMSIDRHHDKWYILCREIALAQFYISHESVTRTQQPEVG